jgi:hypothetical protein
MGWASYDQVVMLPGVSCQQSSGSSRSGIQIPLTQIPLTPVPLLLRTGRLILPSQVQWGTVELFAFDQAYVERLRDGDPSTEHHFV